MEELRTIFEELRNVFSIIAVIISFWSIYTVKTLWYRTNRPIISVAIKEDENCYGSVTFNLVVFNSGNRPATNIVLEAKKCNIDKILIKNTNDNIKEEVYQIFGKSSRIQLLLNGENTKTAFFGYANDPKDQIHILEYESELPIKIRYQDLEGNKYTSKLTIRVRDSDGFGGSLWRKGTK